MKFQLPKNPSRYSALNRLWWIILVVCISTSGYVFVSKLVYSTGFPLDDAWIHQTYARNLAVYGEWSFLPGQTSSGSTSPLWSGLLAIGYLMKLSGWVWAIFLGVVSLSGLAWVGDRIMLQLIPSLKSSFPWMGLLLALEWHMVWSAVSGMETTLYAAFILLIFLLLSRKQLKEIVVGLLVGFSVWIRPDGITMLGPIIFILMMQSESIRSRILRVAKSLAGFLLGFLPYLLFNRFTEGNWWPNTFYAKQAEYAVMTQISLLDRFVSLYSLPLIGVGVLLLPGFFLAVWRFIKSKSMFGVSAVLWWVGYTGLYMLRLPVVYQHGRYLMPAMPIFFIIGVYGTYSLLHRNTSNQSVWRIMRPVLQISIILVTLGFWIMGAFTYAEDVAIIQTEMVQSAKWLKANTKSDDLIAAHDIGAIGYFSDRNLIDLAGLVSPDVIPFIRDEKKLIEYINQREVKYLVTFPDWYPEIVKNGKPIYSTNGKFAIRAGGENMTIYKWNVDQ